MADGVIYANTEQLERVADLLSAFPKSAGRVVNRVLVRAADTVRVETARLVPKVFGAPQKEIRSALNNRASRKVRTITGAAGEGSVSVEVAGRPLTVTRFRHTPSTPPSKGAKRRRYRPAAMIYRARGMKPLRPVLGSDGKRKPVFLAPTKGGSEARWIFFRRTGAYNSRGREKIEALRSLSIPQMVVVPEVSEPLVKAVNETLGKRIAHELDREFDGLGANLKGDG